MHKELDAYDCLHYHSGLDLVEAADQIRPELDTIGNQFTLIGVLQEKGQGHTLLGEPEKAPKIYRESERIKPFRPMGDQGILIIQKAQAYI